MPRPDARSTGLGRRRLRTFPELAAGGYTRIDGTVEFHQRVNALTDPSAVVVDLGAGRGRFLDDPVDHRRALQDRRGRVARLVGLDVDAAVLDHPGVDEAHVLEPGGRFPLGDGEVDVVVSDFVFEHVDDPAWVSSELDRIVKPGGWICARTPNRWGLIALPARLVPNRFHAAVLARAQPSKQRRDTFPTRYGLNTPGALRRFFPPARFEHHSYTHESEPGYVGGSALAWVAFRAAAALTPAALRSMHHVFLRKRDPARGSPPGTRAHNRWA